MCRIVGYLDKKHNISDISIIEKMVSMERHGGPDDNGYELCKLFSNDGNDLAIGFTRLSILDVSYNGHQPMYNGDKTICLTLNGEVYNAFDYKEKLISKGYNFRGNSDTEVVLYLYMEYGITKMLEMINGMFSICIFDQIKKELYLIRDRLGVKPLYYYNSDELLLYSSEYKTFYAHPQFRNELNIDALTEHLMFKFIAGENTLLKNVKNVLPAHYLKISEKGIEKIRYWQVKNDLKEKISNTELEKMIEKSITDRLLSDVKLGIQLSGGVDSTLVLEYMSRKLNKASIETYSIIFEEEEYSEKKYIDYVAQKYNVNQHQIKLTHKDFCELLKRTTWHLDAPLNHPNSIGIFKVCEAAKDDGTKVLMTGEGADETFGGYAKYVSYLVRKKYKLVQRIYSKVRGDDNLFENEMDKFIATSILVHPNEVIKIYPKANIDYALEERRKIYSGSDGENSDIRKALNYELETYLVDVLNRQDKMSMAQSIETRVPFLNYKLIEQVRSQETNSYIKGNIVDAVMYRGMHGTKIVLKEFSSKYFGRKFAYRKKSGFSLPLRKMFCSASFKKHMDNYIIPALKDLNALDMSEVNILWNNKENESELEIGALWVLVALGEWASIFLGDKEKVTNFI